MNQFGYFWWSSIQKYVTEWCLCYLLNLRSIVQIVIGGIFFSLTFLEINISIPHLMVIKTRRPFNTLRIQRNDISTTPGCAIEPNMGFIWVVTNVVAGLGGLQSVWWLGGSMVDGWQSIWWLGSSRVNGWR